MGFIAFLIKIESQMQDKKHKVDTYFKDVYACVIDAKIPLSVECRH